MSGGWVIFEGTVFWDVKGAKRETEAVLGVLKKKTHPCGCLPQWYLGCTGLGKKPPQHGSSACPDTATDD